MTSFAYFASNLLNAATSPLGLFLLALVLLELLPAKLFGRFRRKILLALTLLFAFSCTDFCGRIMLKLLETIPVTCDPADKRRPSVTLVLGGGAVAEGNHYQPSVASQRRLRRAKEVFREFPNGDLLLSGVEAQLMAAWLKTAYAHNDFLIETRSLNTRENIRESALLLRQRFKNAELPQVLLVTDRFHTARAMCWARAYMEDFTVIPLPAPSLVSRAPLRGVNFLPTVRGLQVTSMAWREFLALARDSVRAALVKQRKQEGSSLKYGELSSCFLFSGKSIDKKFTVVDLRKGQAVFSVTNFQQRIAMCKNI